MPEKKNRLFKRVLTPKKTRVQFTRDHANHLVRVLFGFRGQIICRKIRGNTVHFFKLHDYLSSIVIDSVFSVCLLSTINFNSLAT